MDDRKLTSLNFPWQLNNRVFIGFWITAENSDEKKVYDTYTFLLAG